MGGRIMMDTAVQGAAGTSGAAAANRKSGTAGAAAANRKSGTAVAAATNGATRAAGAAAANGKGGAAGSTGASGAPGQGTELDVARGEIEATDREIVALIARRLGLARAAGATKQARGLPVWDPAREAAVLRVVATEAREQQLDPEAVRQVFWCIIGLCRGAQNGAAHV
jgi:chorismate mutase